MARKPSRPSLFETFDTIYARQYEIVKGLYAKGISTMIENTINKMTCTTCIVICEKEIEKIKPNASKTPYNKDRYSEDLAYWVTLKELFKNKMF